MNKKTKNKIKEIKSIWRSRKFDQNGSYSGNSLIEETPLQDQDDL